MIVTKAESDVSYPSTWDAFVWPEWVSQSIVKEIESFYSERWGRSPAIWRDSAQHNHAPKFGLRIKTKTFLGREVCGRFIFAWNNIGRLVSDDGKPQCIGVSPFLVSKGGLWCKPTPEDYE